MTNAEQNNKPNPDSDLSHLVLQKIENEHVAQVPRWQFTLSEYSVWLLWVLSVCIGAIAFSVIIFFAMHARYAPYEATHDGAFLFFLEVMPYAWVVVFILMAVLAHFNLRHTKRGYKFAVWQILLSSIVVSFMGGALLHTAGMGFKVDSFIAQRVPFLPTFHTWEARMWQEPQEGRMIGRFVHEGTLPGVVTFEDAQGAQWELDTRELNPLDLDRLYKEEMVRVVGLLGTTSAAYFHGCGVLPWMPEKNLSLKDLKNEREVFIERMRAHHEKVIDALQASGTIPEFISKPLCAGHRAVLRLERALGE
jgi:hypothetical protein